jgi:hypothetical protein
MTDDHDETQRAVSDVLRARPPEDIPAGLDARLRARLDAEPGIGAKVAHLEVAPTWVAPTSARFSLRLAPAFIALALVVGAVAGYVVRQQSTSSAAPLSEEGLGADAGRVVQKLSEELALTDTQRREVARILAPLEPLRSAAPVEIADARVAVRSLLTAVQRQRFDKLGDNWSAAP